MMDAGMEKQIRDRLGTDLLALRTDDVLGVCRPAVELLPHRVSPDELPLGASRLGGPADLPAKVEWPRWRGEPQSLIAQIRLQDVAGLPGAELLPESGWLAFFYTARQDTRGFDPEDHGSWAVLHSPPATRLVGANRSSLRPGVAILPPGSRPAPF